MLTRPKKCYCTGQGHVNISYVYSIFSALQALQQHFCWSIHYAHALCCCLYTILGLALNVLIIEVAFVILVFANIQVMQLLESTKL